MCMGGGGGYSAQDSSRDRDAARQEAEAQRIAAENDAQLKANASTAQTRNRRRANSLLAAGAPRTQPQRTAATSSVLAMGAQTLGGS